MLQLSQRPLTASDADAELYAGRIEQQATVERAIALGFNSYVYGVPGSGKTSLVRQLTRSIADLEPLVMSATDIIALPAMLLGDVEAEQALPPRLVDHLNAAQPSAMRLLILLDGVDDEVITELFGRRRDELWELPLQWVVTGDVSLRPPADAFFEATVSLTPLEYEAATALLQRRAGDGDDAEAAQVRKLAEQLPALLGPSQPRHLLGALRHVMLAPDPAAALAALRTHSEAREDLSETASRVLQLMTVIGPTYAGDERLLKELGMTRNRMVQVFGELEISGLVDAERAGKRKMYRIATIGSMQ